MRVLVVWGFSVTMAIFSPTRAFSNVLLPALGRPMMETKPERNDISFLCAPLSLRASLRQQGKPRVRIVLRSPAKRGCSARLKVMPCYKAAGLKAQEIADDSMQV